MASNLELFEKLEAFQNLLISYATGGAVDEKEFQSARNELLGYPTLRDRLPSFVRTHRDWARLANPELCKKACVFDVATPHKTRHKTRILPEDVGAKQQDS